MASPAFPARKQVVRVAVVRRRRVPQEPEGAGFAILARARAACGLVEHGGPRVVPGLDAVPSGCARDEIVGIGETSKLFRYSVFRYLVRETRRLENACQAAKIDLEQTSPCPTVGVRQHDLG